MDKKGVEEAGPILGFEFIWIILSIAVLISLFYIFTRFVK